MYKFFWVQTFVKMTKEEQNTNHFLKYIHIQFYQLIIIPISHMSSFNMLYSTTQVAMSIQNFKTIVIGT